MAIKVQNITVVSDSRELSNIASLDANTVTTLRNAGLGEVSLDGVQTLTNKTLDDPKILLANTNGNSGQTIVSQGPNLPPVWSTVEGFSLAQAHAVAISF